MICLIFKKISGNIGHPAAKCDIRKAFVSNFGTCASIHIIKPQNILLNMLTSADWLLSTLSALCEHNTRKRVHVLENSLFAKVKRTSVIITQLDKISTTMYGYGRPSVFRVFVRGR